MVKVSLTQFDLSSFPQELLHNHFRTNKFLVLVVYHADRFFSFGPGEFWGNHDCRGLPGGKGTVQQGWWEASPGDVTGSSL